MNHSIKPSSWKPPSSSIAIFTVVLMTIAIVASDTVAADEGPASPNGTPQAASESVMQAALVQAGPRALSQAFRSASQKATPAVVTILTYGQPIGPPAGAVPPGPPRGRQGESGGSQNRSSDEDSSADDPDAEASKRQPDATVLTGLGSGVIISADGQIITNNHVIVGAAGRRANVR